MQSVSWKLWHCVNTFSRMQCAVLGYFLSFCDITVINTLGKWPSVCIFKTQLYMIELRGRKNHKMQKGVSISKCHNCTLSYISKWKLTIISRNISWNSNSNEGFVIHDIQSIHLPVELHSCQWLLLLFRLSDQSLREPITMNYVLEHKGRSGDHVQDKYSFISC